MKSTSKKGSDFFFFFKYSAFFSLLKFWPTLNCLVRQWLNSVKFQLNSASDTGIEYQSGKTTVVCLQPLPVLYCSSILSHLLLSFSTEKAEMEQK